MVAAFVGAVIGFPEEGKYRRRVRALTPYSKGEVSLQTGIPVV